jgi:hypothetical protein
MIHRVASSPPLSTRPLVHACCCSHHNSAQHCAAPTDPSAMGGPHLMRPCRRGSWDTVRDRRSSTPRRKRACCLQRERESATTVHCGSHQPVLRGEQVTHHHSLPAFSLLKLAPALAVDRACGLCSFPMQAMPNLRPLLPSPASLDCCDHSI